MDLDNLHVIIPVVASILIAVIAVVIALPN